MDENKDSKIEINIDNASTPESIEKETHAKVEKAEELSGADLDNDEERGESEAHKMEIESHNMTREELARVTLENEDLKSKYDELEKKHKSLNDEYEGKKREWDIKEIKQLLEEYQPESGAVPILQGYLKDKPNKSELLNNAKRSVPNMFKKKPNS